MDLVSLHKCEDLQEIVGKIQDMNVCVLFQQKVQSWQIVNFGGTSVIKKHYYSWQDIEDMCTNIVKQMYASNYIPDYIVGITRGGNIPATILSNMLNIPCDAVKISLRDDTSPLESNKRMALDAHKGKNIHLTNKSQGKSVRRKMVWTVCVLLQPMATCSLSDQLLQLILKIKNHQLICNQLQLKR